MAERGKVPRSFPAQAIHRGNYRGSNEATISLDKVPQGPSGMEGKAHLTGRHFLLLLRNLGIRLWAAPEFAKQKWCAKGLPEPAKPPELLNYMLPGLLPTQTLAIL